MDNISENKNLYRKSFAEQGYIQVYTGDGKGKTTASIGLAMRTLGWGGTVLIVMFAKGGNHYGEIFSFSQLCKETKGQIKIVQAGLDRIICRNNITDRDKQLIKDGWETAKNAIKENKYNLIILDEANIAMDLNLINLEEMLAVLKNKPKEMEIVLTGRNAKQEIIDIAQLVSEIKPVKHYWNIGVKARKGIEF